MEYSKDEIMQYIAEEDVKFIRLAFTDVFGRQKNISIMPDEVERAFDTGIAFDASAISGFGDESSSDLFLHPDSSTITVLPWRPEHGRVVRMFCSIKHPTARRLKRMQGQYLKMLLRTLKERAFRFPSERKWSFIFLNAMKTASRLRLRMTTQDIWTSPRTTRAKTSDVRFA